MHARQTVLAKCVVTVVAIAASFSHAENAIVNGGFEAAVGTPQGGPTSFGYWKGDVSEIVTASGAIFPFEGDRMLRFIYADITGPSAYWNACDVWQLVDMSPFQGAVDTGRAVADVSAHFNRVLGDSQTDTRFAIVATAFAGSPSDWLGRFNSGNYLAYATTELFSDGDPSTWEPLSVNLPIPVGTKFIAVDVLAHENIFNDAVAPEFDGHYADAVSMTITVIPAPAALLLGSIAVGFVGWLRAEHCRRVHRSAIERAVGIRLQPFLHVISTVFGTADASSANSKTSSSPVSVKMSFVFARRPHSTRQCPRSIRSLRSVMSLAMAGVVIISTLEKSIATSKTASWRAVLITRSSSSSIFGSGCKRTSMAFLHLFSSPILASLFDKNSYEHLQIWYRLPIDRN